MNMIKRGDIVKANMGYKKQITKGELYEVIFVNHYHIIIKDNKEKEDEFPMVWFIYDIVANRDKIIYDILK